MRGLILVAALFGAAPASAQDAEAGAKVFRKCMACHSVEADGPRKSGPNLHGVIGRQHGALDGYSYSPAMRESGEGGVVWDDAGLMAFLENPRSAIRGTKMVFAGLRSEQERKDVIAYLHSVME